MTFSTNLKRTLSCGALLLALTLGTFGGAALSSTGDGGTQVAHASDCNAPKPQPDLDCPTTPTPTPTP